MHATAFAPSPVALVATLLPHSARPARPARPAGPAPASRRSDAPALRGAASTPGWAALIAERATLVRFARRRLLDPSLAEDVVHDVFEAVVSGRARFDGRASLRTWLTAILKHKIVDLVRSRRGHESLDQGWGDDDEAQAPMELTCPQPGPDEMAALRQRLHRTLARIEALPDTLRQAFERRVLADEESAQVCQRLGISENNLFVRLHRARALLAA